MKNKIKLIFKTFLVIIFLFPKVSFSEQLNSKLWINSGETKSFSNAFNQNNIVSAGLQRSLSFEKIKSKISISSNSKKLIMFDQSFVELKSGNKTFGIGKINRNWSFSPTTSLILSKNARPADSIYYRLVNEKKSNNFLTSWAGPISLEVFNSFTSGSNITTNSMLFGIRAVIEPVQNLMFEIIKTSQWGGDEHSENLSSLIAAFAGNTNIPCNDFILISI